MDQNPYQSPEANPGQQSLRDERLLRLLLKTYKKWRTTPPAVIGLLFAWRTLPLTVAVGVVVVVALIMMEAPREVCGLMGGMYLGLAMTSFRNARLTVRVWRFQKELMDWNLVEEYANELNV